MRKLASKTLNTILSLQDNCSKKLIGVSKNFSTLSKEAQKATLSAQKSLNNLGGKIEKTVTKIGKLGVAVGTALGGFALGTGLSEAMDLEGYRVQLETATKSTEKTTELMKKAIDFANKTPFETGEVVQATAKMEMYGLSSERWLTDVADMAGSTNKSIDQATEAMADVAVGEFERIKEFGLKKDMILAESNKKYGEGVVINAQGQVVDQEKLMDTVQEMMQKKYGGGAEKLSKTTKGMWSTITGITKNSLAKIVGIGEDGQVKAGSLLDKVRIKIQEVGDKLTEWQNNGIIDDIAKKFSETFSKIYEVVSKVFNFIAENKEIIITIASMALAFTVVSKAIKGLSVITKVVQVVFALLKGTIALTPIGWIILGITLLVGAFVLAYQKSETFRAMIGKLGTKLLELGKTVMTWFNTNIMPILSKIKESLLTLWNTVILPFLTWLVSVLAPIVATVFSVIWQKISKVFTMIGGLIEGGLTIFLGFIDFITGVFTGRHNCPILQKCNIKNHPKSVKAKIKKLYKKIKYGIMNKVDKLGLITLIEKHFPKCLPLFL